MKKLILCLFLFLILPSVSQAITFPTLPPNPTMSEVTTFIALTARMYGIDPQTALYVSYMESKWNPNAIGDHGTSFGIWQIHNPTTKSVRPLTVSQAHDIAISTFWAMQTMMDDGSCRQWSTCPRPLSVVDG